ncbi:hydrogenase [bacterium]|nr:hydrogenase [bacterium]MBU1995185.1 hydrogenase [bacterium]
MAIKQVIEYKSDNKYFAGFLQAMIKESGILGSVSQSEESIVLKLDDSDEKALSEFSMLTSKYLAHSLFLGEIQTIKVDTDSMYPEFTSPTYNIAACPKCLENLTDPASQDYLNDSLRCNHYSNENSENYFDDKYYSPHYSEGSDLLVVDPKSVNSLFIMTDDEIKALFCIEKPTLKVTIKDEALKELTGKKFINIKSPLSIKSNLVALNARESEIDYLFFDGGDDLKVVVVQKNIIIVRDTRGISKKLQNLDADNVINRFLNISKEAGFEKASLGASLSTRNGISFLLSNETGNKKVINFQPFRLKDVLELMHQDENKSRLLPNFAKKYPQIMEEFSKNDAYGLFETIAAILELKEKSFESLSDKSLEFHGNGGVKIDTNFGDNGFDYVSFIGSIMSFKLANTKEHYLAYSLFEALGDMAIATLSQLKTKFKINNFVMMGDMFENSVLYSRILSKFQQNNHYFSKGFALDD